ncbi:MAG TPA: serine hydrolase [Chitinophagaceae bacterium]|nr:serine hydrolase [Chitinophagaceae bacterium]
MRKNLFSVLLLTLVCNIAFAQKNTNTDKRLTGIDTALSRLLKDWHAAGFAVAVVEKDKVVYSKGFGYRDYENKKPVTANTLFAIGSCTKAFTAALLGILEKEDKLSLNKKPADYLPGFRFFNNEMNNQITIRDMISHRTGLPRHDFSWYLFSSKSRDSLMQRIQYQEPSAGVRERWQYNNFMYLAQGVIAEKITGKSWEENIKTQFFSPLGMSQSNFSISDLEKAADYSFGYINKDDSIIRKTDYYNIDAMGPAGSINSSVTEMAQWITAWIYGGKYKGKEVIPASYVREAMSSQMVMSAALPGKENPDLHLSNYGLGWMLSSYRGHYRAEHGGNIDGFSASVSFFPSDSIGIIVLTNQNGSVVTSLARNIIADRMLKLKYIDWSSDRKKALEKSKAESGGSAALKSDRVADTKPGHPLADYEGLFHHPGYGNIEIAVRRDSLMSFINDDSLYLHHYHYDVFEARGYDKTDGLDTTAGGIRVTFITNESGKVDKLLLPLEGALKAIEFSRKPKAVKIADTDLQQYAGEYLLGNVTCKVYIKEGKLFVYVPGQPDYETIPTGNHSFSLKALDGYSVQFELAAPGEINTMSFIQPNGTFKATRKK